MGIEKTKFPAHESIHWIYLNADINNTAEIVIYVLIFSTHCPNKELFTMKYWGNHGK